MVRVVALDGINRMRRDASISDHAIAMTIRPAMTAAL